jgi:hypothetical protein
LGLLLYPRINFLLKHVIGGKKRRGEKTRKKTYTATE